MNKRIMSIFCSVYCMGSLFSMQEEQSLHRKTGVLIKPIPLGQPASPRTMARWRVSLSPRKHNNDEKLEQCNCLMYYLFCLPCCALWCKVKDAPYDSVE